MSVKHYLATYGVIDGEHEHSGHLMIIASNKKEASSFARSLTHEFDRWDDESDDQHPWSYGDGRTASKLRGVREISEHQSTTFKEFLGLLTYRTGRSQVGASGGPEPGT